MQSADPRFPAGFFTRSALELAQDLLGFIPVRRTPDGTVPTGVIAETEACLPDDPACHACVCFVDGMHFRLFATAVFRTSGDLAAFDTLLALKLSR